MTRAFRTSLVTTSVISMANLAHAAGFPQLDKTWYANQVFWLVVTFAVLYAVVSTLIVPSVGGVLKTRRAAIDDAIREAERAKHIAESTRSNVESANMAARNNAASFLAKAQAETSAEAHTALSKLDHDIARKINQADIVIEESKVKAHGAMAAATASLASSMASKLLGREVSEAEAAPIVTRLIKAS